MSLSKRIGVIVILIVTLFGSFCLMDIFREYNIKSKVIGYFQHETETFKINDFEYEINNLIFTNSGNNENEYFAIVNAPIVTDFDNSKKYTTKVNDKLANRVYGDFNYINSNFTNKFYGINDSEILTDTLNIKINFYIDGTKIIFTTNNGEKAVKLWSSFIQKNGFNLKIVEDNYEPLIEADNLPTYNVVLMHEDVVIDTLTVNALSNIKLPDKVGNYNVKLWKDIDGNSYSSAPIKNLTLYAEVYEMFTVNFYNDNEFKFSISVDDSGKTNRELPQYIDNKTVLNWQDIDGNIYSQIPLKNINLYANIEYDDIAMSLTNNDLSNINYFSEYMIHFYFGTNYINDNGLTMQSLFNENLNKKINVNFVDFYKSTDVVVIDNDSISFVSTDYNGFDYYINFEFSLVDGLDCAIRIFLDSTTSNYQIILGINTYNCTNTALVKQLNSDCKAGVMNFGINLNFKFN